MGKFLNGLVVGIGIGLFIALQNSKETRRLIIEPLAALRKSMLSEDDQYFSIDASPPQRATFLAEPDQSMARSSSEPVEQVTTSVARADPEQMGKSPALSSPAEQRATFLAEPDQSMARSSIEPVEQFTASVARADPEQTEKSPALSSPSNRSSQTARRKASTRTSNASKTRGHNK